MIHALHSRREVASPPADVTCSSVAFVAFSQMLSAVLKSGAFFAFTEHGLGPKGNPIFPLPWADNEDMSFLLPPETTVSILKKNWFLGYQNF